MKSEKPFIISQQPLLIGEILRRNAERKVLRFINAPRTHLARLSASEIVESNLPLPKRPAFLPSDLR
jgi:hypothetical protein